MRWGVEGIEVGPLGVPVIVMGIKGRVELERVLVVIVAVTRTVDRMMSGTRTMVEAGASIGVVPIYLN